MALVESLASASDSRPAVLFCGGFKSNMGGSKALALELLCRRHEISYTRFDYSGHGISEGEFVDGNIDHWLTDTLTVFDQFCPDKKIILVGSSMGAWIATLAAVKRPSRIAGLITIAAAPDFTERLLLQRLTSKQQQQLHNGENLLVPSEYDDGTPYPISLQLIENSRKHCVLTGPIPINAPVRLLHGDADIDVPYELSIELMQAITSSDIQLTLVKNGDHRLSSPEQLALLEKTVLQLTE
ncbi:hypothetical protein AB833_32425 [Chromatiales bacterium (ex Bugula neritina AB1)]|nr:hypothetical protein AB833_32425 [Chromatiales bacterium (ex Bugula neritina AB1)]